MHEDTTFEAPGVGGGISRRDMLRKSAVVGGAGALMWAAPSITKYGSAAFGQEENGTPVGRGLSYIALKYNCNGADEFVKFDLASSYDSVGLTSNYTCQEGNFNTPGCDTDWGIEPPHPEVDANGDCELFDVYIDQLDDDGAPVTVTVQFKAAHAEDCLLEGTAFGKCGQECLEENVSGQTSVTFSDCP